MMPRKAFSLMEFIIVVVIVFVLSVILVGIIKPGRLIGGINSNYGNGVRIGKVIKFGEKTNFYGGYKSWEGAMQVSEFGLQSQNQAVSTVSGNVWEFSIPEKEATDELTEKILLALKQQRTISLTYYQYWSRPATISTDYVVTAAEFPEEVQSGE
jgi:hypothetical protein